MPRNDESAAPAPHLGAPRPHHGWMPAHTPPHPPLHLLALPRDALAVGCQALVLLSELFLLVGQFCSQVIEQAVEPGEGQQSSASPKRHLRAYPACMKALGLGAAYLLATTQCRGLTDPEAAGTGWPWAAYSECSGDGPALGSALPVPRDGLGQSSLACARCWAPQKMVYGRRWQVRQSPSSGDVFLPIELPLLLGSDDGVLLVLLLKHLKVVLQLLLVQLVDGFHLLELPLQVLAFQKTRKQAVP